MLFISASLALSSVAAPPVTRPDGVIEQRFDGPALVCGVAFAIEIGTGEHAIKRDSRIDFLTYYVEGRYGSFVLYEGNAPQAHDDEVRTRLGWPQLVAIHDNRGAAARREGRIRDRLLVGDAFPAACPAPAAR
ncbi:MAG TPA: hypothetical protein VGO55_03735 [Allosphingosinicella sp.]|jgi:hypothetical protein|nr:hypothetical protein [Allosphingosinicella sp.]